MAKETLTTIAQPIPPHVRYAAFKHKGQSRKNGEPYIMHPLAVMERVRDLRLSDDVVRAAVLHDVHEDCGVSIEEIEVLFGSRVAFIVFSLSKDDKEKFSSGREGHSSRIEAYLERLEKGMRIEPELVLLKICDQLDNLRSLHVFPIEKCVRILRDLKDLYFPLYRKCEQYLCPDTYERFLEVFNELMGKVDALLEKIYKDCFLRKVDPVITRDDVEDKRFLPRIRYMYDKLCEMGQVAMRNFFCLF